MPTGKRKCKVCGKLYDYCKTARTDPNMFRWMDVACSPEHGAIYLAQVMEARGTKPAEKSAEAETGTPKRNTRKRKAAADRPEAEKEMA